MYSQLVKSVLENEEVDEGEVDDFRAVGRVVIRVVAHDDFEVDDLVEVVPAGGGNIKKHKSRLFILKKIHFNERNI